MEWQSAQLSHLSWLVASPLASPRLYRLSTICVLLKCVLTCLWRVFIDEPRGIPPPMMTPSDATSLTVPFNPPLDAALTFTTVSVSHEHFVPSDIPLPPIKRQKTDDAFVDTSLAHLLPLSPTSAILPGILEPLDSLLALPVPSAAVSASEEESDDQRRSRRREEKRRRRRLEAQEAVGGDDDYQPMVMGQGEEDDDEMTLLMDDIQRVEGEDEDELRALQADAEVDIEQLRQQMRQAEEDEGEENGEAEEEDDGEGERIQRRG